jgi:hypothetical protein
MNRMRKPPLKENRFRRTQGKFNFQAKCQYQTQYIPKSFPNSNSKIMGNFLAQLAKRKFLNEKEIEDDWATESNWICNDQKCPNPYTHARGDPCKLTMEDLFPSRPEPPTSEVTDQPEDESEDWLIEWDRENRDKNN